MAATTGLRLSIGAPHSSQRRAEAPKTPSPPSPSAFTVLDGAAAGAPLVHGGALELDGGALVDDGGARAPPYI